MIDIVHNICACKLFTDLTTCSVSVSIGDSWKEEFYNAAFLWSHSRFIRAKKERKGEQWLNETEESERDLQISSVQSPCWWWCWPYYIELGTKQVQWLEWVACTNNNRKASEWVWKTVAMRIIMEYMVHSETENHLLYYYYFSSTSSTAPRCSVLCVPTCGQGHMVTWGFIEENYVCYRAPNNV